MKQKLKKLKLLFAISLAGLLYFSCQADKDVINENLYEKNGVIMHKKFEELIQETQFKTAFDKISKPKKGSSYKGSATSRTVMEEQYSFTIEDHPANVVVSDSITSYTFLITRENTTPNVFENLIVKLKENQEPKAYILKYESNTSFTTVPYNFYTFQGTRTLEPIIYNASPINSLIDDLKCELVTEWICVNHNEWEVGCTGHEGGGGIVCTGGGSSSSGSSSSSGGSGGGGGVPTAPVPPPVQDPAKDPCTKIDKMKTNLPTASQQLETLSNTRTDLVENGIYKLDNAATTVPAVAGANTAVAFMDNLAGQYTLLAHTHNSPASATYSVFSYDDLLGIAYLMKLGKISPDCVFVLPTADGTNYTMTIDDQAAFLQFFAQPGDTNFNMQSYFNLSDVIDNYYDLNKLSKNPKIKENSTDILGDEIAFINMITDLNMGASLMEANATFTTFTKVSYDKKRKIINRQPCN